MKKCYVHEMNKIILQILKNVIILLWIWRSCVHVCVPPDTLTFVLGTAETWAVLPPKTNNLDYSAWLVYRKTNDKYHKQYTNKV